MNRGLARFWYRFKNWFRTNPGPGEPLRFLCGSEEELRRVTTWVCHCCLHLFADGRQVHFAYNKDSEGQLVGFLLMLARTDGKIYHRKRVPRPAVLFLTRCSSLAAKYNTFESTVWWSDMSFIRYILWWKDSRPFLHFVVQPPCPRERSEALLALSEWLDGKVSEQEKRELLQLPDDVGV